jgi:hypothetical protein
VRREGGRVRHDRVSLNGTSITVATALTSPAGGCARSRRT